MGITILSFLLVTFLIALISWYKTKNDNLNTSEGYFLAGRGLGALVIGCSMVLTSLSTEQLIGLNGSTYKFNFSIMAWTVVAVIPLCVLAKFLLPKYIRDGYTTIPEFFEKRFDRSTRLIMSGLFLFFYTFIVIPTALYTGALAFNKIFDLKIVLGLNYSQALWVTVWVIGIIGSVYAIFGGLKAVAVSDTLNAIAVIIVGLLVPYFGLKVLGSGHFFEGIKIITTQHIEKLNAIGSATDPTPWLTIFTGLLVINFFYWSTNQAIVQRALGARDLKSGQKGILIAAFILLLLPILLNLPGLITFHLIGEGGIPKVNGREAFDLAYPILVKKVLPLPLLGFFIAAMLGAILSTFNSFLNSAATLYCKDLLPVFSKKGRTEKELIIYAKKISTIMAILTMSIAPLLMYGTDGIFLFTKRFAGFFNIPIVALFVVGIFNKTVSGKAAKVSILLHVILYGSIVWVFKVKLNFVHVMGLLFIFDILSMLILGLVWKREIPYVESKNNVTNIDLKEWEYVNFWIGTTILSLLFLYSLLSPIGLASGNGKPLLLLMIYIILEILIGGYLLYFKRRAK
ncbi:solute:sodium symporter family transporter [Oceanivirga salmonicida]|uniref:solute:sodium symporter family transporter n=1 Tax=Oceanivirga salmonicida TaxID=1769291 RepID=UPI0012E0EF8C|nr:solute:sodium symporter family transporter [Oceanivirga salmonicida]